MHQETNFSFTEHLLKGGITGCISVTATTPLGNYTNHVIAQKSMQGALSHGPKMTAFTWKRAFDGVIVNNMSIIPITSLSLMINNLLIEQSKTAGYELTSPLKLIIATVAGMTASVAGVASEAIAQAQQLTTPKPQAFNILRGAVQHHGFFALNRGSLPTMVRQGLFTAGYLGLMPLFSTRAREITGEKLIADLFSALVCALIIGPMTTPLNRLRFERQKNFHQAHSSLPYQQIIKQTKSQIMTGWKPRTLMSFCSMFILHQTREIYDRLTPYTPRIK